MTTSTPDIEIYLKRASMEDIAGWLEQHFTITSKRSAGETIKFSLVGTKNSREQQSLNCTVYEKAAKGGYVSVLFEPNHTPWENDEACARNAFEHFGLEVRCIVEGWTPESDDEGGWYRFTESGQARVNWLT